MKNKLDLIIVSILGLILLGLYLFSRCEGKDDDNNVVAMEEEEVVKPQVKNVKWYRRERVVVSEIPKETPTDEGFLVVEGNDSIELCTDIISGYPYRIIIEGERRVPLCKLFDMAGDSAEWDNSIQVLRFSNDSIVKARLLVGMDMFPFGISEDVDSIPDLDFCSVSFAELTNNSQDSIHSGSTRFPILGSATILFYTAAQEVDKLYLKIVQPGLLSVCVVYDETVCGYPLFWEEDSVMFEDREEQRLEQDSIVGLSSNMDLTRF